MFARFLPFFLAAATACAGPDPFPDDLKVTLELDKPGFFLGENILVHLRVENRSKEQVSIARMGDLEIRPRANRFEVWADEPDGKHAPAAFPKMHEVTYTGDQEDFPENLEAGEVAYISFPLSRHCRLDHAGTYTLHVKHDLGFARTDQHPVPEVVIPLIMKMPDEGEAREVLAQMDKLPDRAHTEGVFLAKDPPYRDYTTLQYPVYVPLLRERARSDTVEIYASGMEGLSENPAPEVTAALIEMTHAHDQSRAADAAELLALRIPAQKIPDRITRWNADPGLPQSGPPPFTDAAWREQFAPAVLERGRALILSSDPGAVASGARMVECLGTGEDLPTLAEAFERMIPRAPEQFLNDPDHCRAALDALENAATMVSQTQSDASPAVDMESAGGRAIFLSRLYEMPSWRPPGATAQCVAMLDDPHEWVQARALQTLIELRPFTPEVEVSLGKRLPRLLLSKHEGAVFCACTLAAQITAPGCHDALFRLLDSNDPDFDRRDAAAAAAFFQGFRREALHFWAVRLDRKERRFSLLQSLCNGLLSMEGNAISSLDDDFTPAKCATLQQAWERFLTTHDAEIDAGKYYTPGDAEVRELFPPDIIQFFKAAQ